MTSFLRHAKLFRTFSFWNNDETFNIMTNFLTSWCVYDIMTNFVCDKLFDVMPYMLHLLTSW